MRQSGEVKKHSYSYVATLIAMMIPRVSTLQQRMRWSILFLLFLSSNILLQQGDGTFCYCLASIRTVGNWNNRCSRWSQRTKRRHQRPCLLAFIKQPDEIHRIESTTKNNESIRKAINDSNNDETVPMTGTRTNTDHRRKSVKGSIDVSASIELPFPKTVAYDAFADLSRFSSYSPWLKSVEYVNNNNNDSSNEQQQQQYQSQPPHQHVVGSITKWKVSYLGLQFTWNAISTKQDRNLGVIEWESITGLKNNGRVTFQTIDNSNTSSNQTNEDDSTVACTTPEHVTLMNLTMSFVVPKIATRLLPSRIAAIVEERILYNTLCNFRRIVNDNDWKRIQENQQQQEKL